VLSGGLLTAADADTLKRLSRYAANIGLAFQIIDDILDVTSTRDVLGKTAGKDLQAQKVTYPSLWGIDKSRQEAQNLVDEAKAALDCYGVAALPLQGIADYITARSH
jgi:geranylgeranyl diphosphate synthase type II